MADVRTYRAETMQQALDIVRRELGPEAVILHTREIPQPRFLKWRRTRQRVEITAGNRSERADSRRPRGAGRREGRRRECRAAAGRYR